MKKRDNPNSKPSRPKQQGDSNFNSAKAQCARLLAYLRKHKSCSSIEATQKLDIIDPRRRIKDLRDKGHHIEMIWSYEPTPCGRIHRVGRYHLIAEAI